MKIAVITFGTRGDVQPFLVLADGLKRAGHDVFLGAPSNFANLAAEHAIPFRPMNVDFQEIVQRPESRKVIESGSLLTFFKARMLRRRQPAMDQANLDTWLMTEDVDAMVFRAGAPPAAYSIAQKRNIPGVEVMYIPLEPSAECPAVGAGVRPKGGRFFNRVMGEVTYLAFWRMFLPSANRFRKNVLNMPPLPFRGPLSEYKRIGQPTIYVYSPTLLPKPSDWRPDAHVVGFMFLETRDQWRPPADLLRFLDSGQAPIYAGFGSMTSANARKKMHIVIDGIRCSGARAVIQFGLDALTMDLPETIFAVDDISHNWLFPKMSAIIHHGAPGTMAAALRSGVPSIIVPHNFDHPFWAQRVYELGVSPKPVRIQDISADRIAAAIHTALTDEALRQRAKEIGNRIRSEDGTERAVTLIQMYIEKFYAEKH